MTRYVIDFADTSMADVGQVGGKNASLGEMISKLAHAEVRVPVGFATTADAYREFLAHQGLAAKIKQLLDSLDVDDVVALAKAGAQVREWILNTPFPAKLKAEIKQHYEALVANSSKNMSFAVRSSATAEDL